MSDIIKIYNRYKLTNSNEIFGDTGICFPKTVLTNKNPLFLFFLAANLNKDVLSILNFIESM